MLRFRDLHVQISRIILKPKKSHTNRIIQIVPCKTALKKIHQKILKNQKHTLNIFIKNELANPYNSRGGELLFIPHINKLHFGAKLLRCNGPLTWNDFSQSMNNNNFFNVGISELKNFLKDLILENY